MAQVSEYEDEILANGEPGVEPERFPADQREGEQFAVGPSVAQQAVFDDYFPQLALRAGGVGVVVKAPCGFGRCISMATPWLTSRSPSGQRGAEKCSQILVIDPVVAVHECDVTAFGQTPVPGSGPRRLRRAADA
ncbi:MAG: hypothetical protein ACLRSE_12245 [Alistipes finegoldii]